MVIVGCEGCKKAAFSTDGTVCALHPPKKPRPGWDVYLMSIAQVVATRGNCDRKQVGAVLALEHRILATGYNGAGKGLPTCEDEGHDLAEIDGRMSCVRTIHAEKNAILQCAKHGISLAGPGVAVYVTASPCFDCFIHLVQAGVKHIIYSERYDSARSGKRDIPAMAKRAGVLFQWLDPSGSLWTAPDEIPG